MPGVDQDVLALLLSSCHLFHLSTVKKMSNKRQKTQKSVESLAWCYKLTMVVQNLSTRGVFRVVATTEDIKVRTLVKLLLLLSESKSFILTRRYLNEWHLSEHCSCRIARILHMNSSSLARFSPRAVIPSSVWSCLRRPFRAEQWNMEIYGNNPHE